MPRFRKRRFTTKRFRRARGARKLNARQKAEVKKLISIRQEKKYFDSITSALGISSAGVIFQITPIPQGDTDTTRDGDRLMLTSFHIRASITIADTTDLFRLIFFQWKPNSTPTITSMLLNGPSGAPDVWSHYSHDNRQQFRILLDKFYHMEGNGTANFPITTSSQKTLIATVKPKLHQLQYTGGTTTGTNQVYYIALSTSAVVTHPVLNMAIKFMFTDS